MKRRTPKRLVFRKVKRPAPRPPLQLQYHRGNSGPGETSGCILLKVGDGFQLVGRAFERAAASFSAAVATIPREPISFSGRYSFELQLSPKERACLLSLVK
jgi:hypothetical protein